MKSPEKITGTQLGLLLFSTVGATLILIVPGIMVAFAKQDAWMSVFPAALTGLLSIWVMTTLAQRYPGLTITQYGSKIIGKWLGIFLGFYYCHYLIALISQSLNQHIQFISLVLLPKSPSLVIILTLMCLCGLTVYAGIEVIGRCNELLTSLIVVLLIALCILAIKESDPGQLKPLLGEGIQPILQGAVGPSPWMSQFFFLGWLLPVLNQPEKARKISLISLLGLVLLIFIIDLMTIMVFGPLTDKLNFSFLSVIQYVGIEGSFERLEAIAVSMWMMAIFIKISVLLFMLCLNVSHLFNIPNYRGIVTPLTLLCVIGWACVYTNSTELQNELTFQFPVAGNFIQIVIPLLLLTIDTLKRIGNKSP
ncbi:GerAB/ArcD/ProY family transporter [Paenibacillus humicola]|uniref:GerAB/ArcD/ProY family transporter n=1 Tax=Paenibacillus humicola TaxID=3110540 RepID=UPI00237BFE70|nr:endospore germination permease [Paenibacillus humicola]